MKKAFTMGLLSLITYFISGCASSKNPENEAILKDKKSIHQFEFMGINGDTINFSDFKGKKILIVNTASECGFTKQYDDLEKLHQKYQDKLVVIGFPANNFGGQEPGSNQEIVSFCRKNFGVSFILAAKSSVKGKDINPVMEWLIKESKGGNILWNFEKFMLDENGLFINRFRSITNPMSEKITSKV